ncbi:MAG TPA: hypothetical protein VKY74_27935, partial [Chloroflexia bacterium]|nr:hypothetical protein [Chloroflexia bacterium]
SGLAEIRDGSYQANYTLNRLARLLAAGYGGQILVAPAAHDEVAADRPPGVTLRDMGEHRLKDVSGPQRVYQVVVADLQAEFPPLKTLDAPAPAADETLPEPENPYKGLRAFQEADAADFFGRAGLVRQLVARLAAPGPAGRFLAVVGPSGSGKSSVVRAGLVPALRRGDLPGADRWFVADLIPGAQPLAELEAALLRVAIHPPPGLGDQLRDDDGALLAAVAQILPADPQTELLLVVDQFEEVFTLVDDEATRRRFLGLLTTALAAPASRLRVVVTLRADFYDRPLLYPVCAELFRQGTEVVVPLQAAELQQAVAGPAARVGVQLAPELLTVIGHEVGGQPGALPLLQYALTELFERRVGRLLTLAAYRASGGVLGALARRAEEIYTGLAAPDQELARQLVLRLVTLGEGVEDTRRRVPRPELESLAHPPSLDRVLAVFGHHRLLTFDRDPLTREPTVEVAHEALIRTWPRVRTWLDASRADLRTQRQLATAAADWRAAGSDPSFLATGARLAQFGALGAGTAGGVALTAAERAYLAASLAADADRQAAEADRQRRELAAAQALAAAEHQRAAEQARAARHLRRRALWLSAALVAAGILAIVALVLAQQASQSEATAVASLQEAESLRLAGAARNLLLDPAGNAETATLLSIRGLQITYSGQADEALQRAVGSLATRRLFAGHTGPVRAVAVTPDGHFLLTGGDDGSARLWDLATGRTVRTFAGPAGPVRAIAIAPDGRLLLTGGGADGSARLWDLATGQPIRAFAGHTAAVTGVAFAPDGHTALTGSADRTARLWDVQTGQALRTFPGHTDLVSGVAFTPDGRAVVTSSMDKTVRLWDAQTGAPIRTFGDGLHWFPAVTVSPDGQRVIAASIGGGVQVWDRQGAKPVQTFMANGEFLSVAVSPDNRWLLAGNVAGAVWVWDLAAGRELRIFTGHTDGVGGVAFTPDSKSIVTGSTDQTARLWDLPAPAGGPGAGAAGPPPGSGAGPQTGGPPTAAPVGGPAMLAVAPDGQSAATSSAAKTITLWELPSGRQVHAFPGYPTDIVGLAFAPAGQGLLIVGGDGQVQLWDTQTGRPGRSFATGDPGPPGRMAFSATGDALLTGWNQPRAQLWDVQTGMVQQTFTVPAGVNVFALAFAPGGHTVLIGSSDNLARLWDVGSGQLVRTFAGHTEAVQSAAFAPDGRTVLTGTAAKSMRLWDVQSGQLLRSFTAAGNIAFVAFAPDGQSVLAVEGADTAELWDLGSGQRVRIFVNPNGRIGGALFAPAGQALLYTSPDGQIHSWAREYPALIRQACSQLVRDLTADERVVYNIKDPAPTCPAP